MFVPIIPSSPSRQAQELGCKMAELVRIFREDDPNLSFIDVRQAMRVAERELSSEFHGAGLQKMAAIGVLMAVLLAGLFAFFFFSRSGTVPSNIMMISAIGVVVVGIAALLVVKNR